jgi:hypothetical protein
MTADDERPETFTDTGLDWRVEDQFTDEERETLLNWYRQAHGSGDLSLVRFAPFLIEFLPAEFKLSRRHLSSIPERRDGVGVPDLVLILCYLHSYVATSYTDGILYQLISARHLGASRELVLDVLRYAYLSAGPRGMNAVAKRSEEYLRDWSEDETPSKEANWPADWAPDPKAFQSGIDLTTIELTAEEVVKISQWHEHMHGVVPRHVELLAKLHPHAYKLQRIRYEKAVGAVIPAQLVPLLTLHLATMQLNHSVMRQAAHQARVLGARRHHVVQVLLGGLRQTIDPMVLESAIEAVGDELAGWDDEEAT